MAEDQQQWGPAREYLLRALALFEEYADEHNAGVTLGTVARVWQASQDAELPGEVASVLGVSTAEVEQLFQRWLERDDELAA